MPSSTLTLAADLLPWWFAVAFWLAFLALVVLVARDVRRMGGIKTVARALRDAVRSDDR